MGFKDYLSVIRRRWFVFLPSVALVIGAHMLWATFGQPQLYTSASMVTLSPPIAGASPLVPRTPTPASRVECFGERPVLQIARELLFGERPFLSKEFEEPLRKELIQRVAESAGGNARRILDEIQGSVRVTLSKDERVATVEAAARTPDKALVYPWLVIEAARIFSNERCIQAVERTIAGLKTQLGRLEKEKESVLQEKTEFAKRTGFTNLPRYQEMIQTIILNIDGEMSLVGGQQKEIERTIDGRVARSQKGVDQIQAVAAELGENPRLKDLREQLLKVRREHDLETSRLTEKHPTVIALMSKIEHLEGLISEEEEAIVGESLKKWNDATRELVKKSAGLALKLDVLKERKASLSRELLRLAEVSQEHSRIEEQSSRISAGMEKIQGQITELEVAGIHAHGQVQIHDLGAEARLLAKRGTGAGPMALAMLLAIIFGLGVVFTLEYIDTRVVTELDVKRYLGLPLLGMIPSDRKNLITEDDVRCEIAEKFNTAATLIRATAKELGMKSFLVTSAVAQEGKTTVSVNLAVALARKGVRVILVDADLRAPKIHEVLNLPNKYGLSSVLESQLDPRRIIDGILSRAQDGEGPVGAAEALLSTEIETLSVLTSGPPSDAPIQLLESDRMQRLLKELSGAAEFVIFDTPPVNRVGDALTIAGLVDASIFVIGSGLCEQHEISWAKHLLTNMQANLLGVFLNRYARRENDQRYYYSYYRAGGGSRKRAKARV